MQKTETSRTVVTTTQMAGSGRPTVPPAGRQPFERRSSDPSSCFRQDERYPIPAFFEYRVRPRDLGRL